MLNRTVKLYISAVIGLGVIAIGFAAMRLRSEPCDPAAIAFLAALTILASALKIKVPGVDGNISLNFVPIVLASILLPLPEAVVLTAVGAMVQSTAFVRKFNAARAGFNCAALTLSATLAGLAGGMLHARFSLVVQLMFSACVYYIANSVLVTVVVGLATEKPVSVIWNDCLDLYLPYFAAGIACAMVTISGANVDGNRRIVESPGFVLLPAMLLVRQYFKISAIRLAATR